MFKLFSIKMVRKEWDLYIYIALVLLLLAWAFQIRYTCEEIGCLAVIIPIIGLMSVNAIEFIINLVFYFQDRKFSPLRWTIFVISGLITLFSLFLYIFSLVR